MADKNTALPYGKNNPVIYDNDCHCDVYTDELLLALSSAGEIDLRGFITTTPANPAVNLETYELDFASREEILKKARRSGLRNIPPHYRGPSVPLSRPDSGKIQDTIPLDTPGSRFIVNEAAKATPEKPLVILMGGPLTVAADAWLLDPSIADRIVVAWLGGTIKDMYDYNGWADPWAAYIVLMKMNIVQFPVGKAAPEVPKSRLMELPDCELRQWMIDKRLPHVNPLPKSLFHDGDAQPVISLLRKDYIIECKRVSFSHWGKCPGGEPIPAFKDDPKGNAMVVTAANGEMATEEWWRAVKNPAAWGSGGMEFSETKRPFYASPFPIGKIWRIEAEDFDHGGEGIAYHKISSDREENTYRDSDIRIIPANDVPGGYNQGANGGFCVAGMKIGEWLEYTIIVEKPGLYSIGVRAASARTSGAIHIEFNSENKTGAMVIPCTGGETAWESVFSGYVELKAGKQVMRLVVEGESQHYFEGSFNYIEFVPK